MQETSSDLGARAVAAMLGLAQAQDLRRRAEAGCREAIDLAAQEGDLGALAPEQIQVVFRRIALVFDHSILSYPFVETAFDLCVADPTRVHFGGLRPVGSYRLITMTDGTDCDDYFVLDQIGAAKPGTAPDATNR